MALNSIFDFGKSNTIIHTDAEKIFIANIAKKFKLSVIDTCFDVGKLQCSLDVWIDFHKNKNHLCTALYKVIKNNHLGPSLNTKGEFRKSFIKLAENIIDEYLKAFGYNRCELPEIAIYIYDFKDFNLEYAYGHAIPQIKKVISKKYEIKAEDIFVFYEPAVTILIDSDEKYESINSQKDQILLDCYNEMKKWDPFNFVAIDNVVVNVYLKSELDKQTLNIYYMRR